MPTLEVIDPELSPDLGAPHGPADHDGGDEDSSDGANVRWVTIATFFVPAMAHLARLKLESEDIPCFINDEHITAMAWHYALATGGVKLKVPETEVGRAEASLAERSPTNLRLPDTISTITNDLGCPHCSSLNSRAARFTNRRVMGLVVVTFLLIGFHWIVALVGMGWCLWSILIVADRRCDECGYNWSVARNQMRRGFDVLALPAAPSTDARPSDRV